MPDAGGNASLNPKRLPALSSVGAWSPDRAIGRRPLNPHPAPGAVRALGLASLVAIVAACAGPGPTPAPTEPPPTQSPVQASPNPNLVAFETHIRASTTQEGALIRDLAAAQTGSQDQQRIAARQLVAWAANEQTWLEANIADTCYEPAWQSWSQGVSDISKGATVLRALAEAAPPPTDAQGQSAGAQLASGGQELKTAADLAQQARAACRGQAGAATVYRPGVSQTGYSRTFSGVPSFAEPSQTRSVPHWAFGTVYATVTSNVPLSQKQAAIAC